MFSVVLFAGKVSWTNSFKIPKDMENNGNTNTSQISK